MSFILTICSIFLVLISLFIVLIVLMQRANANSGMGAALGGGMSESTFGAETGNVLTRWTVYAAVIFFILSFLLYLGHMHQMAQSGNLNETLPSIKELKSATESTSPITLPSDASVVNTAETKAQTLTETETKDIGETPLSSEALPTDEGTTPVETEKTVEPKNP